MDVIIHYWTGVTTFMCSIEVSRLRISCNQRAYPIYIVQKDVYYCLYSCKIVPVLANVNDQLYLFTLLIIPVPESSFVIWLDCLHSLFVWNFCQIILTFSLNTVSFRISLCWLTVLVNACVHPSVVGQARFGAASILLPFLTLFWNQTIMAYVLDAEMEQYRRYKDRLSLGNVVPPLQRKIVLHPSCVFKNICGQRPLSSCCWN